MGEEREGALGGVKFSTAPGLVDGKRQKLRGMKGAALRRGTESVEPGRTQKGNKEAHCSSSHQRFERKKIYMRPLCQER